MRKYTPECITELKNDEVFVFGSNLWGSHGGGAAKIAYEQFGARWGVRGAMGCHGHSYAIPTLDLNMEKVPMDYLEESCADFLHFAESFKIYTFYVTKIGCGIAGFDEEDVKKLFINSPDNVILPKDWDTRPYEIQDDVQESN